MKINRLKNVTLLFGALFAACWGALASSQSLQVTLTDTEGERVSDAVVELVLPEKMRAQFSGGGDAIIDQLDKEFIPTITTIVVGSKISFPNSDDILHHVYSFSPVNTFDIPLYGKDVDARFIEEFPQAGVVEIGCNIHDWMLAYIYIAESSKVAISNEDGIAEISNLPAGTFPVRIWHSRLPRNTDYIMANATITASGVAELEVSLQLERDRRIRRAPSANRTRYK